MVGSTNIDLVATTARFPGPGETLLGSSFSTTAGGKGAKQALAPRLAGSDVRMIGAVGDDIFAGEALAMRRIAKADLSGSLLGL